MLYKNKYHLYDIALVCARTAPAYAGLLLLFVACSGLIPMFTALATAAFIDTALSVSAGEVLLGAIRAPIILVALSVAADWLSQQGIDYFSRMTSLRLKRALRQSALEKQAKLAYRHIENPETWDVITRVCKRIEAEFANAFCSWNGLAGAITLGLRILSVVALLLSRVWWAALITFAFSVPLVLLARRGGKANYQANRDTEREERLQDYLINTLLSREVAEERALFGFTRFMTDKFASAFKRAYKLRFTVEAKWFTRMKLSSTLFSMIAVLISLTLLFAAVRGELTIGLFMSLSVAAFSLVQSMSWQLTSVIDTFTKAQEYLKDLTKFMDLDEAAGALDERAGAPMAFESLEFRDVRFAYPGTDRYVLNGLSLTIRAGEHVSFVGVNGAGKTTVTKLMTGLYTEFEGEILINGVDIRKIPINELREMYALVFQDFARYPVSIKENIAFGRTDREQKVEDAAFKAGLDEAVRALKDGYDARLGRLDEGGQELSGGQWQRVAIARALASPAKIRILDEPTAALDPIAEADIYQNFSSFSKGVCTIFISHRLGSTKLSERVYVLGEGRVLELGTHDELMRAGGLYAEMFEAQRSWYQ